MDLLTALTEDHGAITEIEFVEEGKGYVGIRLRFDSGFKIAGGLFAEEDAENVYNGIVKYIKVFEYQEKIANIPPFKFGFGQKYYDNVNLKSAFQETPRPLPARGGEVRGDNVVPYYRYNKKMLQDEIKDLPLWLGKWKTSEPLPEFFRRVWGKYIRFGLTMADVRGHDKKLWTAIKNHQDLNLPWPSDLNLPTQRDALATKVRQFREKGPQGLSSKDLLAVARRLQREEAINVVPANRPPTVTTLRPRNRRP